MSGLALVLDYEADDPQNRALRSVIYGRQSKGKTASIAEQLKIGHARTDRQGWPVVAALSDRVSASRYATRARDDWPKLLALVLASEVDVIWLWETSRGDRKLSTWAALLEACEERGIYIWVETHGRLYDLRRPRDMRTMGEEGVENVYESGRTAERTNRPKEEARRGGALRTYAGGPPPTGYQNGEDDWEAYPPVAAVLADVAARVIRGESLSEAFREQPEVWTPRFSKKVGPRRLTEKAVRAALARPATAGLIALEDGTLRQAARKPPIDAATWRKLQAIFTGRKRGRNTTDEYTFGPVLKCGKCGNQLTGEPVYYRRDGQVKRVTPSYRCKNPHPFAPWYVAEPCRGVSIGAADVNRIIREAVDVWAAVNPNFAEARERQAGLGQKRIELEGELADAQDRMAVIVGKLNRRQLRQDQYDEADEEISREIAAISAQLDQLAEEEADPLPVEINWETMPTTRQLRLVREALVTPIAVAPGKGGAKPTPAAARFQLKARRKAG
jgi:DNA invertase Pin-like site-specific DNA recombinase